MKALLVIGCLLAACAPSPVGSGATASPAATPHVAPASGASAAPGATARGNDCRVIPPIAASAAPLFVALADRGVGGTAFVLDAATAAIRGRIEISGSPEAVLDSAGGQLVLFCSDGLASHLVSYDLSTLRERWRTRIEDRQVTKAPGGIPAIAVGDDGGLLFVKKYKALLPGDANAPGASRYWVSAYDARNGKHRVDVELPNCGAASVHAGAIDALYVVCADGVRVIDTVGWRVTTVYPSPFALQPVSLTAGEHLYGVSRDLRVLGLDLKTGATVERSDWGDGASVTNAWGHLAIAADRSRLWVLAQQGSLNEYRPDTLTEIDLVARRRTDKAVTGLRGVGIVGARVISVADGVLYSTDTALRVALTSEPVVFWHILVPRQP